jgi:hypothetical protein
MSDQTGADMTPPYLKTEIRFSAGARSGLIAGIRLSMRAIGSYAVHDILPHFLD